MTRKQHRTIHWRPRPKPQQTEIAIGPTPRERCNIDLAIVQVVCREWARERRS